MEVELGCAVYGEATVFPVKVALDAPVSALCKAIFEEQRYQTRFLFAASELKLYLARKKGESEWVQQTDALEDLLRGGVSTEYERMLSSWALNDSELFGPTFVPGDEQVHVLVQLPPAAPATGMRRSASQLQADDSTLEMPQRPLKRTAYENIQWIRTAAPCPQLSFSEPSTMAVIPWVYLEHAGFKDIKRGQDLVIYRRGALEEQWNEIQRDTVDAEAVLWIVGPPGVGKSCAAYAFICGCVDRMQWSVLWIHIDYQESLFCIKFEGDVKATRPLSGRDESKATIELLLASLNSHRKWIVFFDGYQESKRCESIARVVNHWQILDPRRRRLVVVTSMTTMNYNLSKHRQLTTLPTKPSRQLSALPLYEKMRFSLSSWTLDEYYAAVEHDELFRSVMEAFDVQADPGVDVRRSLVQAKYFVAGGCARAMFVQSRIEAKRNLQSAIETVRFKRFVTSSQLCDALTRLYSVHDVSKSDQADFKAWIVSRFVVLEIAQTMGPAGVLDFARGLFVNDVINRQRFQAWAMASLCQVNGLQYRLPGTNVWGKWEQGQLKSFDPTQAVPMATGRYFVPKTWHEGGYDADLSSAFFLKAKNQTELYYLSLSPFSTASGGPLAQ